MNQANLPRVIPGIHVPYAPDPRGGGSMSPTTPPTPGDPRQKPSEIPSEPSEAPVPAPREVPVTPEPNEGDRERALG